MSKKLKRWLPLLIGAAVVAGLTTWYLKNKARWQKENRQIVFQTVTL